ncbi:MAG TPA: serine hydrolase [Pyrinomonadaceae bacterium]|nr:serine hydrolase [Acidobacteriota bacterium]HQZ97839.1 serine hydrolase [Pyrinomonadaceae bacterium]
MKNNRLQYLFSFLLLFAFFTTTLPLAARAQTGSAAVAPASQYAKVLAEIELKVEARRSELGIPGMSLVIVKDDQIIYIKGLGYKDFEKKIVVTPDTQFAIGSATKAFTALSVLMTADEGKLSLDDSPKKLLPYFKMYDPETDKNLTIRDLLSHSSGLNRTDLAMITGKLSRAELIQVAAQAKPTAKLREKFQYQNIMFTAAGEIVTQAQKTPWEKFVPERIFKPLGMTNTTMLISEMAKAKDFSFGYDYNFDTKETIKRPFRSIDEVAPAGSINSSARDMAEWLRFVMNGGTVNGKRLVSEKNFAEWIKPQMKVSGTMDYGFGWFIQKWNGLTVVQHGGNIDGFNSMVAMIPEKKLGFVMLTNVSGSSLGGDLIPLIFSNILDGPKAEATGEKLSLKTMQFMAGKYRLAAANMDMEVKIVGEDMFLVVPGQPEYKLVRTAPRQFKMEGAPDGFAVKFTPETGDATEMFLQQPQGNFTLPRVGPDGNVVKSAAATTSTGKTTDLIGTYMTPAGIAAVEIKESEGKVTFNITGQQPYTLTDKSNGSYSLTPLPDTYSLKPKRDESGKVTSVVVTQPEGEFEFKRAGENSLPKITVDELHKKALDAAGGEANWRKLTTRVTEADIDLENQGVKAKVTSWSKAPNKAASETTFIALGKTIANGWDYFDGTTGEQIYSFSPAEKYTGKRLEDARLAADFYGPLDWTANYKRVAVTGTAKINGEDAFVVDFEPKAGTAFKEYYSTTTFLLLKRDGVEASSTSSQQIPYSITFSDYRVVDGIKLPFRTVTNSISNGDIVTVLTSVKHNVTIDDKIFGPQKK